MENYLPQPTFKRTLKIILAYFLKCTEETVIQDFFGLFIVINVPSYHSHHSCIEHLIQLLLARSVILSATIYEYLQLTGLSGYVVCQSYGQVTGIIDSQTIRLYKIQNSWVYAATN